MAGSAEQPGQGPAQGQMNRGLRVLGNVLITVSAVTPASSVFIIAPFAIREAGSGAFWSFAIAAVLGVFMAFCYAELSAAFPVTGGEYALLARALGRAAGFAVFGLMLVGIIFIIGVIAYGTGTYLGVLFDGLNPAVTAAVVIVAAAVVGIFDIKLNAFVTGTFLALELLAIGVLTVLGFANVNRPIGEVLTAPQYVGADGSLHAASLGLIVAFVATAIFAYNGYGAAMYFGEETQGPSSNIAKAVFWALGITVAAELIPLTAVILGAPSLTGLVTAENPMGYVITELSNDTVYTLISLGIALAIINAVIAIVLQAGRMLYSSGRDLAWPAPVSRFFARLHPRYSTPATATVVIGLVAATAVLVIPLDTLVLLTSATLVFSYGLIALGAFVGRARGRTTHSPYTMPLWPLPPVIGVAAMVYVATQQTLTALLVSASTMVVALVYYVLYLRPRSDTHWVFADTGDPRRADETTPRSSTAD